MASVRREIKTLASVENVWSAMRDVGALHTRLVPGFVTDTKLEGSTRIVTFGNGVVVREPIVAVDEDARRVVWTSEGGVATHYNGAIQVMSNADGTSTVVWIADFLPDKLTTNITGAIEAGMTVMKKALDALA